MPRSLTHIKKNPTCKINYVRLTDFPQNSGSFSGKLRGLDGGLVPCPLEALSKNLLKFGQGFSLQGGTIPNSVHRLSITSQAFSKVKSKGYDNKIFI